LLARCQQIPLQLRDAGEVLAPVNARQLFAVQQELHVPVHDLWSFIVGVDAELRQQCTPCDVQSSHNLRLTSFGGLLILSNSISHQSFPEHHRDSRLVAIRLSQFANCQHSDSVKGADLQGA
jgi:hypothetical protein